MRKAAKFQWQVAVFILVAFLTTLAAGTLSFYQFKQIIAQKDVVADEHSRRVIHAEAMQAAFEEKVAQSRAFFITGNEEILELTVSARKRFLESLGELVRLVDNDKSKELLASIHLREESHETAMQDLIAVRDSAANFARQFEGDLRPKRLAVKAAIEEFVKNEELLLDRVRRQTNASAKSGENLIYGIAGIAFILAGLLAYLLLRTTRRLAASDQQRGEALEGQLISSRRFLDLVNHLDHSVVWEADTEPFSFSFISERLQFLIGVPPQELIDNPELFFHYIHENDRHSVRQMLAKAISDKVDQRVEHRMRTVDGVERWVQTGVHLKLNPSGKEQFYGLTVDVSPLKEVQNALKRSEAALQRSTEQLLLITDSQPSLIAYIDHEYRYRFVNSAYGEWFDKSKNEVMDKTIAEVIGEKAFRVVKPRLDEALAGCRVSYEGEVPYPIGTKYVFATYTPDKDSEGVRGIYVTIHDITARHEAENRVVESESKIREYIDSMPAMGFIADGDGTVTFYNKQWVEYTGMPRSLETGQWEWEDIVHPNHVERITKAWAEAVRTGQPYEIESLIRRKDGEFRWILGRATPIKDSAGKVKTWYGINQDVHDYKVALEALRESEERYRATFDQAAIGVAHMSPDGRFRHLNDKYCEILGYTADELKEKSFLDVTYPDDREKDAARVEKLDSGEIQSFESEKRYVRKDGSIFWANVTVTRVRNRETDEGYNVAVVQDITARKSAEKALEATAERLELALNASKIGIWELDLVTKELTWSKELALMFGFPPDYLVLTREEAAVRVHPDDRDKVNEAIQRGLRDKRYSVEYRVIWPNESVHWIYAAAVVHDDENGQPSRVIGANIEITERKEHELRLQSEKETREKFVSMITHDLRTPLSAAKMAAQLLLRKREDAEVSAMLIGRLIENANRMESMIQDLLDTNRIKAGKKLVANVGECNLVQLVQKTLEDLTIVHGDRFVLRSSGTITGVWDCNGLRRVTENLLTNAVKYGSTQDPIQITLSKKENIVEISVHNKGEPMSERDQQTLFDEYARTASAEKSGKTGWGIGLTLVQGIAQAHGGEVRVASGQEGTTFTVWLPLDASAFAKSETALGPNLSH